jgi:hypothetical protein
MRILLSPTKAPALAIAVFVRERGAVYSGEILNHFDLTERTLRRRRSELRRLGIEFIPRGRGSLYHVSSLTGEFPSTCLARSLHSWRGVAGTRGLRGNGSSCLAATGDRRRPDHSPLGRASMGVPSPQSQRFPPSVSPQHRNAPCGEALAAFDPLPARARPLRPSNGRRARRLRDFRSDGLLPLVGTLGTEGAKRATKGSRRTCLSSKSCGRHRRRRPRRQDS